MADSVPLSVLLDTLLQKAYNDLTILQELYVVFIMFIPVSFLNNYTSHYTLIALKYSLPRKSDGDRKLEIVQYARRTRSLVIRLLALVKWVGNSKSLDKCSVRH